MKHLLHHLFLPRESNNHKSKLLHHESIFLAIAFLLCLSFFLSTTKRHYAQVLGSSINIAVQDLLNLTNQKRADAGDRPLSLDPQLTQAAEAKAHDMFLYNYWAHNSPQGKVPWDFIKTTDYPYIYAGENLARGFTSASDVVEAWMNSPEHRENMLSKNYDNVGFAMQRGDLTGEHDTILIVEMLGSKTLVSSQNGSVQSEKTVSVPVGEPIKPHPWFYPQALIRNISTDNFLSVKYFALYIVGLFMTVLLIDLIIIKRKKIVRLAGHNLDHIMFLGVIAIAVLLLQKGVIF